MHPRMTGCIIISNPSLNTNRVPVEGPALVVGPEFEACRAVGGGPSHPHGPVREHLHFEVPLAAGDGVGLLESVGAELDALPLLLVVCA